VWCGITFSASNFSLSSCTLFSPISVSPVSKAVIIFVAETVFVANRSLISLGFLPENSAAALILLLMLAMFSIMKLISVIRVQGNLLSTRFRQVCFLGVYSSECHYQVGNLNKQNTFFE